MSFTRLGILLLSLVVFLGMISGAQTIKKSPGKYRGTNLNVLKSFNSKGELEQYMKGINLALGVQCTFCHDPKRYPSDRQKHKLSARDMMRMVNAINGEYIQPANKKALVTCNTCHRGKVTPDK